MSIRSSRFPEGTGRKLRWCALWPLMLMIALPAHTQPYDNLIVDLTRNHIDLTTAFVGSSITLFGSVEVPGEIIIVVKGTPQDYIVRRHDRTLGFWNVVQTAQLHNMPSYYQLLSSQTLADTWLPQAIANRHMIGFENIYPIGGDRSDPAQNLWRTAFIKQMQAEGKYLSDPDGVQRLGSRLFRAELVLSSEIIEGTYAIETYLVQNGEIRAKQTSPLIVRKVGVSDALRTLQANQSLLYGVLTVVFACLLGFVGARGR